MLNYLYKVLYLTYDDEINLNKHIGIQETIFYLVHYFFAPFEKHIVLFSLTTGMVS